MSMGFADGLWNEKMVFKALWVALGSSIIVCSLSVSECENFLAIEKNKYLYHYIDFVLFLPLKYLSEG